MIASPAGPAFLFCPGNRPDRFDKASERADVVVLDLEDAVGPEEKSSARAAVVDAVARYGNRAVVRVNGVDTPWFEEDVAALREAGVGTVMLPKATTDSSLRRLAGFDVIALCETAAGVANAGALAAQTNCIALFWGGEDLTADLGGRSSRNSRGRYHPAMEFARAAVLMAAAANGKWAIDAVHVDIADMDGLRRESTEAADQGFRAKACIHPNHVSAIRRAFAPTAEQIIWATETLDIAARNGGGVFRHEGRMIDGPLLTHARTILEGTPT